MHALYTIVCVYKCNIHTINMCYIDLAVVIVLFHFFLCVHWNKNSITAQHKYFGVTWRLYLKLRQV